MADSKRDSAVGILGLGAYVPERVMTNDEWAEYVDTSDEWITERTGIKRRRLAADDETTVDLGIAAATRALDHAGVTVDQIDEIVVATDTPEVYIPDTASFVQERLGTRNVTAYDLGGSGCAGFVLALDIARSRAVTEGRTILVIGVELLTRLMNWQDRETCVLFGDAAGAAVVGPGEPVASIVSAASGTDGAYSSLLRLEAGGTRIPFNLESAQAGLHKKIEMNGREVFKQAVRRMSEAALEVLTKAELTLDDVDLMIPHQANLRIINAVGKRLGIDERKVYVNVQEYGNTGSASVPLALAEAHERQRIQPGDRVLLTAFGAGFHWAGLLLEFRA